MLGLQCLAGARQVTGSLTGSPGLPAQSGSPGAALSGAGPASPGSDYSSAKP